MVHRGLDSRYMISRLRLEKFKVLSLTTIASPHRGKASVYGRETCELLTISTGSAVADYVFEQIGCQFI